MRAIGFNRPREEGALGGSERSTLDCFKKIYVTENTFLSHIEAKRFICYGRFDIQTPLSLLMLSVVLVSLMEIKGFWQYIAANKQQWCGFVAAASCGLVAACAFFICKLVLWLPVAATLLLLVVATLRLILAATLRLFVCRECVGLVVDCLNGWVWIYNNKLKKKCREKICVTHLSKLVGTHAILQVYYIFLVLYKNEFNLTPGNV